jgi:hypothetical protein
LNSLHLGETLQKKFFISFLMFIIIGKEKNWNKRLRVLQVVL